MKLLYVTNIPTPYRIARFNLLSQALLDRGCELEVLFMAEIEPDRNWNINYDLIKFQYVIYKGVHPTVRGMFAHFNPGLLFRLLKKDYEMVVIGGIGSPTHMLAPFFARSNAVKIMSVESNMDSTKVKTGLGAFVKGFVFRACNCYQVTGEKQIELIKFFFPDVEGRQFVRFPNLIDESVFYPPANSLADHTEIRSALSISDDEKLWVLPARLSEEKGILEFLRSMKSDSGFKLIILGVGPLQAEIQELIDSEKLPVRLIGFVQEKEVARYYRAADAFVLPSIRDPSPLSPIEAIRTGLPLLVSNRLGNIGDVCDGSNGVIFNPLDPDSIGAAIRKMLSKSDEDLKEMKSSSIRRYASVFDATANVNRYSDEILGFVSM